MCLVALAIDQSRRFPLVVAANRDELHARPSARLAWWTPSEGGPPILSGRDLESGGTWLGLTAQGRLAMLTGVRSAHGSDPAAPSRGRVVTGWLAARESTDRFWMRTALSGHNRFSLVAADFAAGECFYARNDGSLPHRLERGLFGLAEAALDTPWPKVQALKAQLRDALGAASADELAQRLFAALSDRSVAVDAALPSTGPDLEGERRLEPAFVHAPDGRHGTRCSTLVVTERVGRGVVTHVIERSFDAHGLPVVQRHAALRHWPPRRGAPAPPAVDAGPVTEGEVGAPLPMPRARVRRDPVAA